MKNLRVGLYGGTFSPPHTGHVNAAREFVRALHLDKLLVMPANIPPHKTLEGDVSAHERLEMCRLAFGDVKGATVSDYEIAKAGVSYTVDTLMHLSESFSSIFMLCGDDMLLTLDKWRSPEKVLALCTVVCMRRYDTDSTALYEKAEELKEKFGARIEFIDAPPMPLSSTEVREMLSLSDDRAGEHLTPSVLEYIGKNKLYGFRA